MPHVGKAKQIALDAPLKIALSDSPAALAFLRTLESMYGAIKAPTQVSTAISAGAIRAIPDVGRTSHVRPRISRPKTLAS